jgi:signal transduction histidine kinase
MRWPLRNQILLPMAGVMVVTVLAVSVLNAYFSAQRTRERIEFELRDVAATLSQSSFPLTDAVLRQTRGLSGAEFAVTDAKGTRLAASREDLGTPPTEADVQQPQELKLTDTIELSGESYYHAAVPRQTWAKSDRDHTLHIFYPEESWRLAFRQSILPPLIVGGVALVVVVAMAAAIASGVTRPIQRLRTQVDEIEHGSFREIPPPPRDDELRDLTEAVNRMSATLARYEEEVRRTERLRTLDQLGGGIAHRLRNAITGCRMALDLHRRKASEGLDQEELDVAVRQLKLMDKYVERFLTLGRLSNKEHVPTDLPAVIENVLPLIRPVAQHVGVAVDYESPPSSITVRGDADALEQLLVNLMINAVEAAGAKPGETRPETRARVIVELTADAERVLLQVKDTGPGPADDVHNSLFDPLVTEKPDGTGIGLAVAREIAEQHGAEIGWNRHDGMTCFAVRFPISR